MSIEQMQYLALDRITCKHQVRTEFDEEGIAGLAETMRELGQQAPVRVRRDGDGFVIVDGERRYRAAKKAGLNELAVIIEEKELSPGEVIHRQLVTNCQREDLSPMEKSAAISQLMKETGWSATQVAAKLGFSNSTVSRLLALLTLPAEIQERVRKGELPVSAACEIARVDDAGEQAKLAGQVAGGLTRDALSGEVKRKKSHPNASAPAAPARVTAKLGEGRSVTVCAGGMTLETFISVLEELLTKARQARPKGLALDTFLKILLDQSKTAR